MFVLFLNEEGDVSLVLLNMAVFKASFIHCLLKAPHEYSLPMAGLLFLYRSNVINWLCYKLDQNKTYY